MDWCWSWKSNTLATWWEELTHLKRPWCWERLKAGGEGDDTGWDGWMASPIQWTWVCVSSRWWWWTGKPGVLQFMGLQKVGQDWVTELNWIAWVKTLVLMLNALTGFLCFKKFYNLSKQVNWNSIRIYTFSSYFYDLCFWELGKWARVKYSTGHRRLCEKIWGKLP